MTPGVRLVAAVSSAFARIAEVTSAKAAAAVGPFGIRFLFASPALAEPYLAAMLPSRMEACDLSLAVARARDIDLSHLIPSPPERGRAFMGAGYSAIWYADRLPVLYIFDHQRRRGLIWLAKDEAPAWELSRPACPLLQAILLGQPWVAVHAAAVGHRGRFALLVGPGRSGKTTAALACALAGWDYAGDDFVLAHSATGMLAPLYRSARLRIDMAGTLADMLSASRGVSLDDQGEERHELDLAQALGAQSFRGGQLAVILVTRRMGAAVPEFERARPSDAFHAALLNTTRGSPGPMEPIARKLSALVGLAPVFFADTGDAPDRIPGAVARLMDGL